MPTESGSNVVEVPATEDAIVRSDAALNAGSTLQKTS
jgi:hypothetical protein